MRFKSVSLSAVLVVALTWGGLFAISSLGYTPTHLRCSGLAIQIHEGGEDRFPETELGLKVEEFSWFVFWADQGKRVSYTMVALEPNGPDRRWSDLHLPLSELNDTFFSTELTDISEPQVYYDNMTGYATIYVPDESLSVEFEGFCEPYEPAF